MQKKFILILLILVTSIVPSVSATRPNYLYDYAGVVDANSKAYINSYGQLIDTATTAEVVIVTLQKLPTQIVNGKNVTMTIDEAKLAYFNDIPLDGVKGIGKVGKNNGVLIIIVMETHDWAIEVGYGCEGQLTDADCGVIGRDIMTPYFKNGQYGDGLYLGMKAVGVKLGFDASITETDTTGSGTTPPVPDIIANNLGIILFGCAILVLIVILVISFNNSDEYSSDSFGTGRHGGGSSGGGGFGGGGSGGGGAGGHWNLPTGIAAFSMANEALPNHKPDGTHFCPTCKKDTEYSKVSEYDDDEIKDDGVYKDTHAKYLCLTCGVVYVVTLGSVFSESLDDYKARKQREKEEQQKEDEDEESRRRRRDEDDYYSHSSSSGGFGGGSFGGGISGGGGASGHW